MKSKLYLLGTLLCFNYGIFSQDFNSPDLPGTTGSSGTGGNINVVYHRCDWSLNPTVSKLITGTITTYFKTTSAGVSSLSFDLNKTSFNNGSLDVQYHGISCVKSFPSSGNVNILNITLPSTITATGTLDSIKIAYSGTPPAVSGQAEGFQRKQDGLGNWYIYSLSESYEDKDWWPCKADMQDKIDSIDINVTVPWNGTDTFWVATVGVLTDSAITAGNRTFKYKHRYPITSYLVALGVAKYRRHYRGTVAIGAQNVPVVYYTFPDMAAGTLSTALARMDVSKTELVEFSNKYGPYPFANEKHGYYQFGWGGGMEHQTFSAMSSGSMTSWSTIAHELGHQWFGDKVSFGTWNHLWLSEGFAKYSEVLAAELIPSIGVSPASHLSSVKSTARATNTTPVLLSAASIANSNTIWTTNNDNAVYQRGCMIVSMLRAMMGDTRFFQGCRDYLNDPLLAYRSATTADLQRNMENQLFGIDLTGFFNAWVDGTGRTDYTGNYFVTGKTIQIRLTQTRNPVANPFMPMPVVIKIGNAAGTYDTSVVIYHYSPTQLAYAGIWEGIGTIGNDFITYNLSFVPATVTIDPDNKTMAAGTLTAIGTPLGINITGFTAAKTATANLVNLLLNGNEPVEKVVLLRSENGTDFSEAGLMTDINNQNSSFRFTDLNYNMPVIFYRAKIYTGNGIEYSSVIRVDRQSVDTKLKISPSPANETVRISFNNVNHEKLSVRILSTDGRTLMEATTNNNFILSDISNLSPGIYLVQVITNGQVSETNRFLVSR